MGRTDPPRRRGRGSVRQRGARGALDWSCANERVNTRVSRTLAVRAAVSRRAPGRPGLIGGNGVAPPAPSCRDDRRGGGEGMWRRAALTAMIMVFAVPSWGTAEFTTPSLDQWGDPVKRVGPREHVAVAAGRHPNAVWVAPTSTALISGAPVSLSNLSPDTVTNIAAGEELVLRS